ncbi:MAG: branched-chain amino acid transport system II carrier protein [Clostridioides sp.]|jgi:LIVCS family branched-chain amino acid:cation transporter|nr:branched-chain amino acid transport system II carrier protein [Clostridioides sp.]
MGGKQVKDMVIVGFALFAMFFGAGNLIFPPYLGVLSGVQWWIAFVAFFIADGGLALLGVIAMIKYDGKADEMLARCGKKLGAIIGTAIVLCIGPGIAIPRTAATTYEIGILPNFGQNINPWIFSIIFFAIVIFLSIKPSKVVDIVGSYLTPALLIALAVLIIKGIISPLGEIRQNSLIEAPFAEGISQGYQTMDALAAVIFASVIIISIIAKGYKTNEEKFKMTIGAGVVASIGLALVYGGLAYLGATVSNQYGAEVQQTALVVAITNALLGSGGKMLLGLIVALACLTTAIGLSSAAGNYFSDLSKGKLKYEHVVIVVCVFSAIVSNFGVSTIIQVAAPILSLVYPATVTMIILSLFTDKIKNDNVYKFGVYFALIVSILSIISGYSWGSWAGFINKLPLTSLGFNWVVPVIIGCLLGAFVPSSMKPVTE